MAKLTRRQEAILDFIRKNVKEKGYPPSVREIGEAVGLASSSTVHGHLERLQQKGLLRRHPTKPRAIEVLENPDSSNVVELPNNDFQDRIRSDGQVPMAVTENSILAPIIGRVTAGMPITAVQNVEDYFPLPKDFAQGDELFVLEVQGESMIDAGIYHGDYVIVKRQLTASNGEIVVAMTEDDEATVKRFYRENGRFRLQPENPTMSPLFYENVTVLGRVVGVFRNLR